MPDGLAALMQDESSPIAHFYPRQFHLDLNGRRQLWQAVALLPFIDQPLLLQYVQPLESQLDTDSKRRNRLGSDQLYCHSVHPLAPAIFELYQQILRQHQSLAKSSPSNKLSDEEHRQSMQITVSVGERGASQYSGTVIGHVFGNLYSSMPEPLLNTQSISTGGIDCHFAQDESKPHVCALLPGVILPPSQLDESDLRSVVSQSAAQGGGGGGHHSNYGQSVHQIRERIGESSYAQTYMMSDNARGRGRGHHDHQSYGERYEQRRRSPSPRRRRSRSRSPPRSSRSHQQQPPPPPPPPQIQPGQPLPMYNQQGQFTGYLAPQHPGYQQYLQQWMSWQQQQYNRR